jgi:hypothetical protein
MAYGAIKFTEFTDNCDIDWKIQIYKEDWPATNTSFTTGPTGFDLQYKGESLDDKIKSSELSFSFFSQSSSDDTFLRTMATDPPSTYIVEVFRDTAGTISPYWKGVMQTSNFEIKDAFYPQEYKLRAICGLQLLKSKTTQGLTNLVKGDYTNQFTLDTSNVQTATLGSIITSCLSTLPSEDLWTSSETFVRRRGCWNETAGAGGYPNDTFHNIAMDSRYLYKDLNSGGGSTTYEFFKCFDVIEEILNLMNARLYQEDGVWRLEQIGIFNNINNLTTPPRYYRISKSNILLGNGDGDSVISDITATGSQYIKTAGMLTGFSEVIRRVETRIESGEFDNKFIQYNLTNLTTVETPSPSSDFINTTLRRSNTNQFVSVRWTWRANNLTGGPLSTNPYERFYIAVNCFIKCGNKYLQIDLDSSSSTYGEHIWDTSLNPFYSPAILEDFQTCDMSAYPIMQSNTDQLNANPNFDYLGFNPPSTNSQFQIPSENEIEVYLYYRINKFFYSQLEGNDVTSDFSSSDFDVDLSAVMGDAGLMVSIVDENGLVGSSNKIIATNAPSGTEIDGGNLIQDTVRFENLQLFSSAPSLLFRIGSSSSSSFSTALYQWLNVLQYTGQETDFTRLRSKEKVAMQTSSLDLIRGVLLKRDKRQLGLTNDNTTLVLHKPIYIDTTLYLIVGLKFSAVSGSYEVTLQELEYNFSDVDMTTDQVSLTTEEAVQNWTLTGPTLLQS